MTAIARTKRHYRKPPPPGPHWKDTETTAAMFGICVSTVARWPGRRDFPDNASVKVNAARYYDTKAVSAWLGR